MIFRPRSEWYIRDEAKQIAIHQYEIFISGHIFFCISEKHMYDSKQANGRFILTGWPDEFIIISGVEHFI